MFHNNANSGANMTGRRGRNETGWRRQRGTSRPPSKEHAGGKCSPRCVLRHGEGVER